ncbi:hypothetical protein JR316_0001499 [Psilocybe cubensis]|uniref:Uncharacterized protein n=2 Tax=Psilocybe cubensis TaxID=181762 RepID=A0A8H7YBY8_PSICU|nr:hypothetical protein JR316_0001499 [Psilocybe cubensis]KAH9487424.1 hypothetical protein JR316_0001499 [Psilocybe cubensis]
MAHERNIVLGGDLNLGNIEYDVSKGNDGLPYVTFRNLPPPVVVRQELQPSAEVKVPNLGSRTEESTKESDIYNGVCTFLQVRLNDMPLKCYFFE